MNDEELRILQNGSEDEIARILTDFNNKNSQSFKFPDLTNEAKKAITDVVLRRLENSSHAVLLVTCLNTLRILSRETKGLEHLTTQSTLNLLVGHAGLEKYAKTEGENLTIQDGDTMLMIEAQKCLCNLIFNSPSAQRHCSTNGCLEGIVQRLKTYKDPDLPHDIKFFDMRLLFLLTALVSDTRPRMVHQLHGFTYLIEVLDLLLRTAEEHEGRPLTTNDVALACEVLKILFNLSVTIDKNNLDEEEEAHFMRLVSFLHDLLLCETQQKDSKEELTSHTVNLLVNMPKESYEELLTPMTDPVQDGEAIHQIEYDGKNMDAIIVILDFLNTRLDHTPKGHMKEGLTPVLHCLCEISRANRAIRKFCRLRVLPYLKSEVKNLPEEGETLRNKLCKLFTNPVHEVKDLAADFCFVLCKESVSRFVKYTGYGNAAGLLAQRGLMCGGRGTNCFSSDSDESDTEEYLELKEMVNPITGRYEEKLSNPMEGMTDEQKEYEAMKLVSQIDKLSRSGIIQPMRVGEDGRPEAVAHVLELLDSQPSEQDPSSSPPAAESNSQE